MDAIVGTRRVERPGYAWIAVGLQLFTALMAIPVGLQLIANPEGGPLGLPQAWIDATPFGSWLVPGLVLLTMNGLGQLVAAALIVARHPLAPWLTGALGIGLMIWIAVQVVMLPFSPLQPVIFVIGAIEGRRRPALAAPIGPLPRRPAVSVDLTMATDPAPAPRFPGIAAIIDGSEAVASIETRLSEVACAYPITPSTTMAAIYQAAVADGRTDLWGTPLRFIEPESEHSSASAAEGAALAGARVTNFTAGQGLILMKEVLYVIAGKRLPVVFHIGARALTSQALNIHAGHDDVMGVADTGWGILFARNAQEVADLAPIARRVAEATEVPFFVVQDGFLTTHTLETMVLPEDDLLREFVGNPRDHLRAWFDPQRPLMTGVVQNQDSYMKGRLGQRAFYDRLPGELDAAFEDWARLTGRRYAAVQPYRCEDAAEIIVAMGTMADTATAVVDHLRGLGRPVGSVAVTSFRPFPADALRAAIGNARAVAVIERTDEPAAARQPADPRGQGGALRPRRRRRADPARALGVGGPGVARRGPRRPGGRVRLAGRPPRPGRTALRDPRDPAPARPREPRRSTCDRPAPSACGATRSGASGRSRPTSSSPRSSGTCSGCTSRRTRATARRRRACRRPTT